MGSLQGKRALITGGANGLGGAISLELAKRGAKIAVHWFQHRPDQNTVEDLAILREKVKALGGEMVDVSGDLTDEATVKKVVQIAAEGLGGLDILVNNVGDLLGRRTLAEIDPSFLNRIMNINVNTMFLVTREALPHLVKANGAAIVNLASLAGRKGGHAGSLAYGTAKGAVITFTRSLSTEVGPQGIRVNCVAPGFILGTYFHQTHTTAESAQKTISEIPLGRAGNPQDIAEAVAFLAAQYDGFITGVTLDVNGGVYMA
ncbi:MAG: SDR family NAD(P)-dependent oxidoreductase [Bacillota bacterium]